MFIRTIAILLFIGFGTPEQGIPASESYQPSNVYEAVLAGKTCHEDEHQNLWCRYKVGQGLDFEIGAFGTPDGSITFYRSEYEGDYYAKIGWLHGCVIVTTGKNNKLFEFLSAFAFVSPKNGKVYRDWVKCQTGM